MAGRGSSGGGLAARRAVVRWAARSVRRGWRQQIVVVLLLTIAVAATVGFASAAYNLAPASGNVDFGSANHLLRFQGKGAALDASVEAARTSFETIEVIGHRPVEVPGRFEPLDYRSQDPEGPYGGPLLALRQGRFPVSPSEVALTGGVADELGIQIGEPLALDGTTRTIVGLVENPSDLRDDFALVPTVAGEPGQGGSASATGSGAEVPPASGAAAAPASPTESVTILVDADSERVLSFRPPGGGDVEIASRATGEGALAAAAVLLVAAVAMLFIALLAAAGFVVMAQRRRGQLGVLAALGATERHLRLALVANGATVGAVAAALGAAIGVVGWLLAEPRLEAAAGYRIDRFDVPWWVVAAGMVAAVATATAAAWWPARVAARQSIVQALSGRPPRPRAVHRSAIVAGSLVAAGVACLVSAGEVANDVEVLWANLALLGAGTLLATIGVLLLSPAALRLLGASAAPLPVATRLALRDLARFQARSSVALAATALALGLPVAIAVGATAAQDTDESGNLAETQLLVRASGYGGPFVPEQADVDRLRPDVDRLAGELDGARVTELEVAVDPDLVTDSSYEGRLALSLVERSGDGWRDVSLLYVAASRLLGHHGLDAERLDRGADVITTESGQLGINGHAEPESGGEREGVEGPGAIEPIEVSYTSLPATFVTPETVHGNGWEAAGSGSWLLEMAEPPTGEQLSAARALAAGTGLTVESRDHQGGLGTLRTVATGVGALVGLGVLAMTVGLIRSETAPDLRTLTATGATGTTRRALTAVTAGALGGLGLVLGAAGAMIILATGYLDSPEVLRRLPVELLVLAAGTPTVAALAGWVLAGAEPPRIGRQPIA
jgi:putative ABC transport system permease protein